MFILIAQASSANNSFISFKVTANQETQLGFSVINLDLKKSTDHWQVFASPRYQTAYQDGYFDNKIMASLLDNYGLQRFLDLREIGISYNTDYLEMGLGKKIFNWEQTFEINPVDIINPRDFTDLLDWEKIGVTGAWLKIYLSDWGTVEGASSFFVPARLPMHKENQWFLPLPIGLILGERILPQKTSLQNSGRLCLNIASWDLSLFGHNGYNPFPYFALQDSRINQIYFTQSMFGLSFAKEIWADVIFRGETAYFIPEKKAKDDSYLQTVLSFDRLWSDESTETLHFVVQYIREIVLKKGENSNPNSFGRIFKNYLGTRLESDTDRFNIQVKNLWQIGEYDVYLQVAGKYKMLENLSLDCVIDILQGNGFFGQYDEKDRLKLVLKYLF